MNIARSFICAVVCTLAFITTASANNIAHTSNLFGDEKQPGNRLHDRIVELHTAAHPTPIPQAIETVLQDDDTTLGGEAKQAVAFDVPHANAFYEHMTEHNSLIEVTKRLIEAKPDMAVHTITLGVVLYPDHAQEIYDGAALTGLLDSDDILVALLQAGADPTTVSDATAADGTFVSSGPSTVTISPLGAGVGAGGTGGGDTTASTN
ncbi:hypothetical protein ACFO4O_17725 [Glaciecola siphonariae]|uniref:Ankyrin repeat domain-containing protein n=1 Tax=Glaciecola siphonariae TaxID=521012 RepID=A0ABV9M0K4_9ALTE